MSITETLAGLSRVAAIHGWEEATAAALGGWWGALVDEWRTDTLGNFIGLLRADSEGRGRGVPPRVLAAAHMDTVGLMVTRIESGGFLRVTTVGGTDRRLLLGQEVEVLGAGGQWLTGIVGAKPPHLTTGEERKKLPPVEDLFVDLGRPEPEVRALVPVGAPVLYRSEVVALRNGRVSGRYLDDTVGLAAIGVALEELRHRSRQADFYAVGTVGEEVGRLPGAATAAYGVHPDLAIALDVTFGSFSEASDPTSTFALGSGPAIGIGPNCHPALTDLLREEASRAGIPFSLEVLPAHSGTDAWAMQTARGGVPTATLSIPLRYMHTPVELVDLEDVKATGRLLAGLVARATREFAEGLVRW